MAVSFRSASEDVRNTTNSPQPAPPAGTTAGDLLIAVQTCDVNGSLAGMTGAAGWTEIGSGSRGADVGYMKVWRKTATSSEPATYTFTDPSTAQGSTIVLAVTGYDAAGPISVTPTFANGASTTAHPAPSVAATAGDLLVTAHLAGLAGTARTYTAPPNMTLRPSSLSSGPNTLTGVCTLAINADGATGTKTATCSGSAPYLTMSLVITDVAVPNGSGGPVTFFASSEDSRSAVNNAAPAVPTGTAAGDLMLCVQTSDVNGSLAGMTGATGWAEVGSGSRVDAGYMKVWQRTATSSEPTTYTFVDESDAHGSAVITTLYNQDPTTPLTATPVFQNGAASTAHTAPSTAGAIDGILLTAHLAGTGGTSRSYTGPAGMNLVRQSVLSSGGNILTAVYRLSLTTAVATDPKTATPSASTPYVAMALVVTPGGAAQVLTVAPDGVAAETAFGVPTVTLPQVVTTVGLSSDEAFGTPTITTVGLAQTVVAIGLSSAATFGVPAVDDGSTPIGAGPYPGTGTYPGSTTYPGVTAAPTGPQTVTALGVDTAEAFGIPNVALPVADDQLVQLIGIDPTDAFGTPTVFVVAIGGLLPDDALYPADDLYPSDALVLDTAVAPAGIASAAAFGLPLVATADGPLTVVTTPIDSTEAFGVPAVAEELPPGEIAVSGIDSAEAFGRPTIEREVPPPVVNPDFLDTYFIDGLDLSTFAAQIEVAEGLQDTPGTVGDNIALPGRDGELAVLGELGQQRRPDASGRISFSMWLVGVDPDTGEIPAGSSSAEEYLARWDELVRLFHRRKLTIDHPRPDGTRRAIGHLLPGETMAPSSRAASPWFGRFKAALAIPGAHWTDLETVTTGPQTLVSGQSLSLTAFAAATAPCTELTVTFGAGANPRLSTSYGFVGWNGVIAAGRQLGIDTVDGRVHQAGGASWVPGYESLTYSPGPRLFEIDPTESLQAVFTHTTGGTMTVEVSGKRRYRTS